MFFDISFYKILSLKILVQARKNGIVGGQARKDFPLTAVINTINNG